ncbi:hypothetical protein Tco_1242408, partial [Tanacetum coccineum]
MAEENRRESKQIVYSSDEELSIRPEKTQEKQTTTANSTTEAEHENEETSSLRLELEMSQEELEKCRNNLNSCLERNKKLCKEIADLNALLENQKSANHDDGDSIEVIKPILEASSVGDLSLHTFQKTSASRVNHPEEVMDMQLQ